MLKYKLKLKDVKLEDFRVYLFALFKGLFPKKKIRNIEDLKSFIQKKSAWVSQVTLYNYLKTRMGTKWVLHFDDEKFLHSINQAKWNIYSIALQDLTFYSLSYLNVFHKYKETEKAKDIYEKIINQEFRNGMPEEVVLRAKEKFMERLKKIDLEEVSTCHRIRHFSPPLLADFSNVGCSARELTNVLCSQPRLNRGYGIGHAGDGRWIRV